MSVVSISYNSLSNASSEAKHVAKRLDDYADAINKSVYKKLNNYNGPRSSNISTASNHISSKISELRSQSEQYEKYATSLTNLEKECRSTDKSVRSKVSTLTATFKQNHGISNSKIQNTFNYFLTSIGNSTAFGRWLGDGDDLSDAEDDYFKQKIEDWYNYEGGEDLIKGTIVAILEIAIAVVTVVAAITTLLAGGALFAMIVAVASLIGGIIAGVNGITNLVNEGRAYNATRNGDPATGKRRSSEDTLTDTIRTESDSKSLHGLAAGIDVLDAVCTIVSVVGSAGELLKKGYKWTKGLTTDVKNIKIGEVLKIDNFKAFGLKLKNTFTNGWTEMKCAIKMKDSVYFDWAKENFISDLKKNFNNSFRNFDSKLDSLKTTKNILGVIKDTTKDGLFAGFGSVARPCITVAGLPITAGSRYDAIVFDDFYDIYDKIDSKVVKNPAFSKDSPVKADVMEKLSRGSHIKISIPDTHIPEINQDFSKIRVA
ncbi:hypothetical protein [Clostridium fungisolvens]|uniref:Uncharacterized protein n=1 Tax=Clostridium fungisolvens TaxID=1604897 RepID=A0A6V8SGG8_9CLOT|nr:hypothetical protein [Clostridium fungisolvens]GFP74238.1 hypothetical protein bsdtw1_00283 [Clostridium fungisolvens]